eukprot:3168316-Prymnesium_polylepis.1
MRRPVSAVSVPVTSERAGSKPNIAMMLIDDLGWSNTEYGGSGEADDGFIRTPNIKKLEPESIKLNRHYAYAWCAPSRASLMSGRLPVHVNVNHSNPMAYITSNNISSGEGVPAGMTTIATKLKSAGYATHYVGKWGVGFTWKAQHPMSRGFDSFFGYLHDSVDYWNQQLGAESIEVPGGCEALFRSTNQSKADHIVDLIRNDGPAHGLNGTAWVDYLFLNETLSIIASHEQAQAPLFLFHAFHSIHAPLNAPAELYVDNYAPAPCVDMSMCFKMFGSLRGDDRRSYAAMVSWTDHAIGRVIAALKDKGMWDSTLMVVSADNGGPQYLSPVGYQLWGSATNLPLRGGKTSDFEGGIRVNSFVTGGLLPPARRGTTLNELIHFADWFATWCYLAGVDPQDQAAVQNGLPDIDSINQWPLLCGDVATGARTEVQVSPVTLIEGRYKLLTGADPGSINTYGKLGYVPFPFHAVGYFPGALVATWDTLCTEVEELFHLSNTSCSAGLDCRNGCLFDIFDDPNERHDLASQLPEKLEQMMARLKTLSKPWTTDEPWGVFNPIRNGADSRAPLCDACSGNGCTNAAKCHEFAYKTGFYSWAVEVPTACSKSVL